MVCPSFCRTRGIWVCRPYCRNGIYSYCHQDDRNRGQNQMPLIQILILSCWTTPIISRTTVNTPDFRRAGFIHLFADANAQEVLCFFRIGVNDDSGTVGTVKLIPVLISESPRMIGITQSAGDDLSGINVEIVNKHLLDGVCSFQRKQKIISFIY